MIDPRSDANAPIVDLDKASRRSDGLVEYSFDVQILKPVDITKGNRAMLYEVNNRGGDTVYTYFNGKDVGYESSNAGNGFVMRHGYTAVWSGWLTAANSVGTTNPPAVFAQLPVAMQGGKSVIDTAREEWIADATGKPGGRLTYPAASLDQAKATLTVPSHGERFASAAQRRRLVVRGRADRKGHAASRKRRRNDLRVHLPAKDSIVAGLGHAAIRELVRSCGMLPQTRQGSQILYS